MANRELAIDLASFISQLKADQDLLDRLTQNKFGGRPAHPVPKNASFNVSAWGKAQVVGMNLWRVRAFAATIKGFRFVYAYMPNDQRYVILAIVEKAEHEAPDDENFDYELDHAISIRIAKAYSSLDE